MDKLKVFIFIFMCLVTSQIQGQDSSNFKINYQVHYSTLIMISESNAKTVFDHEIGMQINAELYKYLNLGAEVDLQILTIYEALYGVLPIMLFVGIQVPLKNYEPYLGLNYGLVVDISGNGIVGTDLSIYKIKTGMKYWLSGTYGIDFCLGYQSSYIASAHSFYYSYNNIFRNYGFLSIGFIF